MSFKRNQERVAVKSATKCRLKSLGSHIRLSYLLHPCPVCRRHQHLNFIHILAVLWEMSFFGGFMRDIGAWQCVHTYIVLCSGIHWILWIIAMLLLGVCGIRRDVNWFGKFCNRALLFHMLLLMFSVLGSLCWETLILNRLYSGVDPWIEWLPFLPPSTPLSHYILPGFSARMLSPFTLLHLTIAWVCIASPVWLLTWLAFCALVRHRVIGGIYGAVFSFACCVALLSVSFDFMFGLPVALLFMLSSVVFVRCLLRAEL